MTTDDMTGVVLDNPVPIESVSAEPNVDHSGNGAVDGNAEKKRTRAISQDAEEASVKRVKGIAPIKAEFASLTCYCKCTC